MSSPKTRMIEEMDERRENLERALDDIEAHGEGYKCPAEYCGETECTKTCFARNHFDWCLEHSAPWSEDVHGTHQITEARQARDANGEITQTQNEVNVPRCANVEEDYGGCNVVEADFLSDDMSPDSGLYEFENDRWMAEQMSRSP